VREFVDRLVREERIAPHVRFRGVAGAEPARHAEPRAWPPGAREALAALGVERLYVHQAEALDRVAAGENVLLATPTASGKTLAYLLAFLARRAEDPEARAIFLYPLKALARDQLAAIRRMLAPLGLAPGEAAEVYDGDTPDALRRKIRRKPPAVIVTNPDMLHLAILPWHDSWREFLGRLSLVVLDEAHVYRGIFGAHVHHVLRRLLRIARRAGARPRLVAGSATIGAPGEFIETLCGEPFAVVDRSGAPRSARHVVFLEPDMVSPYTVAVRALALAIEAGHRTIAFTRARRVTELMHQWLARGWPRLAPRVASYRAGYLPEERREIERRLFGGELAGVISTSALEAGIDVGGLDACILVGYPGSLATAWQRIGRAGRQDRESLAVLVALPDALDRYVVRHPEQFFSGSFERVVLDPGNDAIADAHLVCAAAEAPLAPADLAALGGEAAVRRAERLAAEGRLLRLDEREAYATLRRRPQREVSLRSTGTTWQLVEAGSGRTLGTLDDARAWFEGHPGAVYLHAGQTYVSRELDPDRHVIVLERDEVDHFTQVYARKETEILERFAERPLGPGRLAHGRLRVTTFIEGYAKKRLFTQEEISRHPLEAPPQVLETTGAWLELPEDLLAWLVAEGYDPAGSLHAVEHAEIGLFPLLAICDRWDLGGISYARHPRVGGPAIFVYDGVPGGVGLARTGYERAEELLERTLRLVTECPCEDGCPACIHSPKCGSGNRPLDKAGAAAVLRVALGEVELPRRPAAGKDEVAAALSRHRRGVHGGVRGGGPLPEGFLGPGEEATGRTAPGVRVGPAREPAARGGPPGGGPAAPPGTRSPGAARASTGAAAPAVVLLEDEPWPEGLARPAELLHPEEGRWLFFDLETLRGARDVGGWGNVREMGLALGVVLDGETGAFRTYFEEDAEELVEDLLAADRVVGFNVDRFDLAVLEAYAGDRVRRVRTLDLLSEVRARLGFRLSLAHLAKETIGEGKSADGLQSLAWVAEGRFDLVERYCRDDVRITAALWAHGRQEGYVVFRSKRTGQRARLPVAW